MNGLKASRTSMVGLMVANQNLDRPVTLQDRMVREELQEGSPNQVSSRIDVLARMPKLPHEIELQGELQDEEELLRLYTEVEKQRQLAENKRNAIVQKKIGKLEQERVEQTKRLQELEAKPKVEWGKEKYTLLQEKRRVEEAQQKDKESGLELLKLQQEHQLEKMFMLKKQLERVVKEKENAVETKKAIHYQLDALDEHVRLQDKTSKEFLNKVLQRGTRIEQQLLDNGALSDAEAADLLKGLVEKKLGEEFSKQALMDKLFEAKNKEIKKNEVIARDKIKSLNTEKKKLVAIENRVLEEKGKHQVLVQRGLDFLVEMELGNAPDVEEIKKNIEVDPKAYRRFRTKDQILVSVQTHAENGDKRVNQLKEELADEKRAWGRDDRTRLELQEFFRTCNRESYTVARDILQLCIEEAVFHINKKAEAFQEMLKQKDYLENKKERITKEMREIRHRAAIQQIRDDLLEKLVIEMAQETVKENMYLSKKIDEKMLDIMARALKLERGSSTNLGDLQVLAQNLEDDKLVAAREAIMNLFEDKEVKIDKNEINKTFEQKWWEINPDLEEKYAEDYDEKLNEKCALI